MENDGSTEKTFRLNFKQNSKREFYCEWTTRGNSIEELKENNKLIRDIALEEIKTLNGGFK